MAKVWLNYGSGGGCWANGSAQQGYCDAELVTPSFLHGTVYPLVLSIAFEIVFAITRALGDVLNKTITKLHNWRTNSMHTFEISFWDFLGRLVVRLNVPFAALGFVLTDWTAPPPNSSDHPTLDTYKSNTAFKHRIQDMSGGEADRKFFWLNAPEIDDWCKPQEITMSMLQRLETVTLPFSALIMPSLGYIFLNVMELMGFRKNDPEYNFLAPVIKDQLQTATGAYVPFAVLETGTQKWGPRRFPNEYLGGSLGRGGYGPLKDIGQNWFQTSFGGKNGSVLTDQIHACVFTRCTGCLCKPPSPRPVKGLWGLGNFLPSLISLFPAY